MLSYPSATSSTMGTSGDDYYFNGTEGATENLPIADFPAEGSNEFVGSNNNYKGSENVKRFSVNNLLQLAADCHLGNKAGEFVDFLELFVKLLNSENWGNIYFQYFQI